MAVRFLSRDVSDLCLGKPKLIGIEETAPLSDAVTALKRSGDTYVSVWARSLDIGNGACLCVGKICMTDVILFLCKEGNLTDPFKAFEAPVSQVLSVGDSAVTHLGPDCSLLEAIDYILEGTQNLVIPIQNHRISNSRKRLGFHDPKYCWLLQEDVIRFLLNSIGAFSPAPTLTIDSLDVIKHDIMISLDEFFHSSPSSASSCCSSDDEIGSSRNSSSGRHYQARSSQAVVCSRKSSLVAVMIQALTHRVNCVWVVEEDHALVGAVTLAGILKVFRSCAGGKLNKTGL